MRQISLEMIVSEILHYMWDPIGVDVIPPARDEYDRYTYEILKMLENPLTSIEDIANYLYLTQTEYMWMSIWEMAKEIKQKNHRIAHLIIDWKDYLLSMQ